MIAVVTWMFTYGQVNTARDLVNPFIGTGGHGHTFPGACAPNGLVQLSPDTRPDGYNDWDGASGYHYSDSVIYGFSHTHLSGTGVSDLCDVLLMPMSGRYSMDPKEYRSSFRKETEQAHAGYYTVHLDGPDVRAELTATERVGVHRYSFPKYLDAWIVIDLDHRDALVDHHIKVAGDQLVIGSRRSSSWANDQRLFFAIEFSRPFTEHRLEPYMTQRGDVVSHRSTKAALRFAPSSEPLIVKVGISAVSIEGARKNLEAEMPHWDFDRVRIEAEAAWNAKFNKIQIQGGTREQQRIFYTALYHAYVAPYIFNDVDGQYRGMDGQVHHADHNVYTVFSLWDTFRALHPLMTILEPDMTRDWIKTFLLHYQQGGRLPVWELWGNETDCMIGYHSVSVIADAYLKGIRGFDEKLALEAMLASANRDEPGLNAYRAKGYISSEDAPESVSRTLEYAYDDACIERFALRSGQRSRIEETRPSFGERSGFSPLNLYDPATGFFRARRNGGFVPGFDPYEVNFNYTEANAWQYSLFAPKYIDYILGLRERPTKFLDDLFTANSTTSGREQADITGLIGQYAHGNEPSHHMAYLYNRLGRPEKTRAMVKRIMDELYHDAPDGLSGNEDCGQMSAWYVLSALGFYPVSPGIDSFYDLGYPLFDEARIDLPNGKTWTMGIADEAREDLPHFTDTSGYLHSEPGRISHEELIAGGRILFDPDRRPPYQHEAHGTAIDSSAWERWGAPVIHATSATFTDQLEVSVEGSGTCSITDANGSRFCPNSPFTIDATSTVEVDWSLAYEPVKARFTKIDGSRAITLESTYANQYSAGGDNALVDGLRGGTDFRTGEWQGFRDQDLQATIDLGRPMKVTGAGLGVLQDQKSWIWFPAEVEFAFSVNGRQWSTVRATHTTPRDQDGTITTVLGTGRIAKRARYVKVIARNPGPCPAWHPGNGGTTWIFADEVLITTE